MKKKSRVSVCLKYLALILIGIVFLCIRYDTPERFVTDQIKGLTALLLMAEHWSTILGVILIAVFLLFRLLPSTFKKMQRCYPLKRLYRKLAQPLLDQLQHHMNQVWWKLTDLISFTSQKIKQPQPQHRRPSDTASIYQSQYD